MNGVVAALFLGWFRGGMVWARYGGVVLLTTQADAIRHWQLD